MAIVNLDKFVLIEVSKLTKAPWNYKEEDEALQEKLKESIKRLGQVENIQIRELDTGFYEVIDGNHRLDAFKALKLEKVVAYNHGKISLAEAKACSYQSNQFHFKTDAIKQAETIKDILAFYTLEEAQKFLPHTQDELEGYKKLLDFDWNQYDNDEKEPKNKEKEPKTIICPHCKGTVVIDG